MNRKKNKSAKAGIEAAASASGSGAGTPPAAPLQRPGIGRWLAAGLVLTAALALVVWLTQTPRAPSSSVANTGAAHAMQYAVDELMA